jgi:hypothetical protein
VSATKVRLSSGRQGKVRVLTLAGVARHNVIGWQTFDAIDAEHGSSSTPDSKLPRDALRAKLDARKRNSPST